MIMVSSSGIKMVIGTSNDSRFIIEEAERPWYDSKKGISEAAKTLDDLNRLISERYIAGYKRGEPLNDFYVLGAYYLDSCGNCARIKGRISEDFFLNIPSVLSNAEFWKYISDGNFRNQVHTFSYDGGNLPTSKLKCASCGEVWTVDNCRDTVTRSEIIVVPLNEFIGKTLLDVKTAYNQRDDAVYEMYSGVAVRSDRYIDLSQKFPNGTREWELEIVKNASGWICDEDGLDDNYVIQFGDETRFMKSSYYHSACNDASLEDEMRKNFEAIFNVAGFKVIDLTSIVNEYCTCEICAPWFNVETEFGIIKIGWRKRVINIDWSGLDVLHANIYSLFEDEDVTRGRSYIHAWGYEKAQEYLTSICSYLSQS